MHRWATSALFLLAAAGLAIAGVAGDLDDGFGTGGVVVTDPGGYDNDLAFGVAVQPADGKVVAAGIARFADATPQDPIEDDRFTVARYDLDGGLDKGFGTDGVATVTLDGTGEPGIAIDVALDASGRVVAVGYVTDVVEQTVKQGKGKNATTTTTLARDATRVAVVRLDADGAPDTSFGTNGVILVDVPGCDDEIARAVAILPDGDLLVAGGGTFTSDGSGGGRKGGKGGGGGASGGTFLIRLDAQDGFDLDANFGNGAVVVHDAGAGDDALVIHGMGVQATEGRIVALSFDGGVRAYDLATGAVDTGFGTNGLVMAPTDERWDRLAVDASEDAVLVGGQRSGDGLVLRLGADGDAAWSYVVDLADASNVNALGVDAAGNVVAGGQASGALFVLRLEADGTADTTFGPDGLGETATVTGTSLGVLDLAVDGTDVVLVGTAVTPNVSQDWFVARFLGTTDTTGS